MKKNFFVLMTLAVMMFIGCQNGLESNKNQQSDAQNQSETNKTTSGLEKNLIIVGKIQDTTCDITLNASAGTFSAVRSRADELFSGEFFYYNEELKLKVKKKNKQDLAAETFCLTARVEAEKLISDRKVTFETESISAYDNVKNEFKQSAATTSSSSTTSTTSTTVHNGTDNQLSLAGKKFESVKVAVTTQYGTSDMVGFIEFKTDNSGDFVIGDFSQFDFTYTVDKEGHISISGSQCDSSVGENDVVVEVKTIIILTAVLSGNDLSLSGSIDMEQKNTATGESYSGQYCTITGDYCQSGNETGFFPLISYSETVFNLAGYCFWGVNAGIHYQYNYEDTTYDATIDYSLPIVFINESSGWLMGMVSKGIYFTYEEKADKNQVICTMCDYNDYKGNDIKGSGTFTVNISDDNNTIEVLPTELSVVYNSEEKHSFSFFGTFKRIPIRDEGQKYNAVSIVDNSIDLTESSQMSISFYNQENTVFKAFDRHNYNLTSSGTVGNIQSRGDAVFYCWEVSGSEYVTSIIDEMADLEMNLTLSSDLKTLTMDAETWSGSSAEQKKLKCVFVLEE